MAPNRSAHLSRSSIPVHGHAVADGRFVVAAVVSRHARATRCSYSPLWARPTAHCTASSSRKIEYIGHMHDVFASVSLVAGTPLLNFQTRWTPVAVWAFAASDELSREPLARFRLTVVNRSLLYSLRWHSGGSAMRKRLALLATAAAAAVAALAFVSVAAQRYTPPPPQLPPPTQDNGAEKESDRPQVAGNGTQESPAAQRDRDEQSQTRPPRRCEDGGHCPPPKQTPRERAPAPDN